VKIDFHYGMDPRFGPNTHEDVGIGGTENFITQAADYLAQAGHDVTVYNKTPQAERSAAGVPWYPLEQFAYTDNRDVLCSFRTRDIFKAPVSARLKALFLADTESHGLGDAIRAGQIDLAMFVGRWQANKISGEENISPAHYAVTSNGVAMAKFDELRDSVQRVPGKCIHLATPERGLEPLLDMWPSVQARVEHASLHLFSSFKGWRVSERDNASMCRGFYERIHEMASAGYHIVNHQHANAGEIRQHLLESELYLYPTRHFNETCCISAIEAAAAGLPIVATSRAALVERVKHGQTGFLVGHGDDDAFVQITARLLSDKMLWRPMSAEAVEYARQFDYAKLAQDWVEHWEREL
jgi:glycosyltransferase involved in cell wall biosynthesis